MKNQYYKFYKNVKQNRVIAEIDFVMNANKIDIFLDKHTPVTTAESSIMSQFCYTMVKSRHYAVFCDRFYCYVYLGYFFVYFLNTVPFFLGKIQNWLTLERPGALIWVILNRVFLGVQIFRFF